MNRRAARLLWGCVWVVCPFCGEIANAEDSAAVVAMFADPPRQYSSGPLWVWNDLLTEEQITGTLEDLAGQKVKQVWVHPRPGLMTPYLSDDWFRLWKVSLREARRLDMNVWIYDENSYPSGFAGGLVPEAMPSSRGRGLRFHEEKLPPKADEKLAAVFLLTDDGYQNVTKKVCSGESLPEARYLVASWQLAPSSGWYGGKWYVDLLLPGVTEKFLEITMGAYRREIGDEFGKRVPGVFTDEPHLCPAGLHYNDHVAEEFGRRWGYSLADNLPSLIAPVGDWKRVRHNYQQVLLEQFIEHWAKPCHEYCRKHNLEFTGHYWEHGWPGASHGPDNMAMYAWHQRPAIDNLMNEYREDVHSQFGNSRTVKELSSVANQLGRRRTLCEAYGAGGWDLRFEDMKRIGDWLYVLGVNTLNEHLSYITIRGARKRDHPQSFSYHTPWWEAYHVMAEYFTRLSLAMSSGQQINRILLIQPTTTAWMYQPDGSHGKQLGRIGDSFQELVVALEAAQVEYDVGSEDIIARHGGVEKEEAKLDGSGGGVRLVVGRRKYDTVVLPPHTENFNAKTWELLKEYAAGGRVICCGPPPTLEDGRPTDRGQTLLKLPGWKQLDPAHLPQTLLSLSNDGFVVHRNEGDKGNLFHHRRRLDDGEILFLVNTSIDAPSSGVIESRAKGAQRWDLETGVISPCQFTMDDGGIKAGFELPPCGSLLLFLSKGACEPAAVEAPKTVTIRPAGPVLLRRVGPNVLTLDYVDITAGGETKKGLHFYKASQLAFVANGMVQNPWDSAVQFRDELITRKFPPESGFEATYRFTIEGQVPKDLQVVVERPDLYTITCNGAPVSASEGAWWLDKSFGRIDVARAAKVGENAVRIKASPMTIYHELEPAYVLGDFALRPADSGFVIVPPRPLVLGSRPDGAGWNQQGHPFHAAGVAYTLSFDVPKATGRYQVVLPAWYGSVAKVSVGGAPAGYIGHRPWQCDVTSHIMPGRNTIEVLVIGTLKNTLGPHHAGAMRGKAWPSAFRQGPETGPPPGAKYDTISYGLFEPFLLQQAVSKE